MTNYIYYSVIVAF